MEDLALMVWEGSNYLCLLLKIRYWKLMGGWYLVDNDDDDDDDDDGVHHDHDLGVHDQDDWRKLLLTKRMPSNQKAEVSTSFSDSSLQFPHSCLLVLTYNIYLSEIM